MAALCEPVRASLDEAARLVEALVVQLSTNPQEEPGQ